MDTRLATLLADRLDPCLPRNPPLLVARIDEALCIGCTLCRQACPVDAIVGAVKRMHTVLPALCVGCELCLQPCPVDCIALVPAGRKWSAEDARAARERYARRERSSREAAPQPATQAPAADSNEECARAFRRQAVAAAVERARGRRRGAKSASSR